MSCFCLLWESVPDVLVPSTGTSTKVSDTVVIKIKYLQIYHMNISISFIITIPPSCVWEFVLGFSN